jgi:hypothetical protein
VKIFASIYGKTALTFVVGAVVVNPMTCNAVVSLSLSQAATFVLNIHRDHALHD